MIDHPLPEDDAIAAAHPMRTGRHDIGDEAMRLVSAKHSKGALVDLVNWLLAELATEKAARQGIYRDANIKLDAVKTECEAGECEACQAALEFLDAAQNEAAEWHSRFEQAKAHADALLVERNALKPDAEAWRKQQRDKRERDDAAERGGDW